MSSPLVPLPCACANLRRAARAVTQVYDGALRSLGLRVTQFTLLQVLGRRGATTQGDLGDVLAIDSTTLSRTLQPLERAGWIRSRSGADKRERHVELTAQGRQLLARATPAWERAQRRLRDRIGERHWEELRELTTATAEAVR